MGNESRIALILTMIDRGLTAGINRAIGSVRSLAGQARQSVNDISGLSTSITGLVGALGATLSVAAGLQKAVSITREFDKISAGLETATGSAQNAEMAFAAVQKFATETPYDLAQVTDSFVKLVNFGLDPSERALTSYGNTSSALGRELNQMIEAVADAATGEFERLKEFGIRASKEGDKVKFTFRGVATEVGFNAKAIEEYLIKLGETNFGDAMANRMAKLDGKLSNLGDEWDKVFLNISRNGIGDIISAGVEIGIDALSRLNEMITSGELEGHLRAEVGRWSAWADDVKSSITIVGDWFDTFRSGLSAKGKETVDALTSSFREFPENVRAFVGIMTVQVAAGFDKAMLYGRAFKAQLKAAFTDPDDRTSFADRVAADKLIIDQAKDESIAAILAEREAALKSYADQKQAAVDLGRDVEALKRAAGDSGDVLGSFGVNTEASSSEKTAAALRKEAAERKKAAAEAKKLYEEQKKIAAEKLRAASQDKILALEQEKIAASKLPTELARAEAELAIDRQIMAERVNLKRQELAAIRADKEASQADIIRSESELAELLVQNEIDLNDRLRDLAWQRMDDIERSWRRGIASAQEYQAAVRDALNAGAIDWDEANERLIASGDDMGAALALGLQHARERMQTDAEVMISIGDQIADRLADGLGAAWDSVITGSKSAKEAIIDMARSTISWLSQMILKQILYNALQKLMGGMGFAGGGSVSAPDPGKFALSFAGGGSVPGYSPHPKADNILAWLTAKEFVEPVDVVDHYGADVFEAFRRKLIPRNLARALAGDTIPNPPRTNKLADGGMAGGQAAVNTFKAGDTKLKVINVLDRNIVGDYMRTADGETVMLNFIRRNGTAIKTILG